MPPPELPCYQCPHGAKCCTWGADLTEAEAIELVRHHGTSAVILVDGAARTATDGKGCLFLDPGSRLCRIRQEPYYPAVCRGFPWTDGILGGPYQGLGPGGAVTSEECPEFEDSPPTAPS